MSTSRDIPEPVGSLQPIFIVGTMRSGSTLLRLILDSHENIAIGEETGFMGALAANRVIPNWRYGKEWYGRLGWSEKEFDARLREFYTGLFARYAADQGKRRWGDKTPLHSWHMGQMARIFPDAVFLAIVRHPGAVVSSLKKRFHYEAQEAADYWQSTNIEILRHGLELGDSRFALVRYEDVLGDTDTTLREITSWLGEPWSQNLLRHHEVQGAKGAPRMVDGNTSTRDPIIEERADRWTSALDQADQDVTRMATAGLAKFLGYDPSGATAPRDILPSSAAGNRRVLTGGRLTQLFQGPGAPLVEPRRQEIVAAEMSKADLVARVRQAEASLARIRARPVVRFSDKVRRLQRRMPRPDGAALLNGIRRRLRSPGVRR